MLWYQKDAVHKIIQACAHYFLSLNRKETLSMLMT